MLPRFYADLPCNLPPIPMAHPVCISQSSPSSPSPFLGFFPPHPPSTVLWPISSGGITTPGRLLLCHCLTVPHCSPHAPHAPHAPHTKHAPLSFNPPSPQPSGPLGNLSPRGITPSRRLLYFFLTVPHILLFPSFPLPPNPQGAKSTGQTLLVASPHPAVSSSSSAAAASVSLCPTCNGSAVMKCSVCNGDAWKHKITFDRVLDSPLKAWDAYRMAKPVMPSPEAMQDPNRAAFWLLQRPAVEEGVEMSERDKEAVWWEHQWNQRYEGMREAVLQKQPGWQQAQQALIEMDPSAALNDPQLDAAVRTKPLKARRLPKLEGDAEARVAAALEEARKKVEKMTPPPRPKDFGSFQLDWVQEPDQSKIKGEAERQQWQREVEEKMLDAAWRDTWQNDKVEESLKKAISRMKAADEAARRAKAAEAAAAAGGGAAAGAAAGGGVGGKGGAASSGGKAAGKKSSGGDKGKGKPCVNWACNRPIDPKGHSTAHP
ncbi:unnamed protein product [Closterium sp. Naga37s-1]|nr:unnamed protein product [Closterium sp. Naga37s-1]